MTGCVLLEIADSDLPSVLRIYKGCEDFLGLGPEARASMKMVLEDVRHSTKMGGVFSGIYDPEGHMVGVVSYMDCGFDGREEQAFILLLMIASEARRKGIGREVVMVIENQVRKKGSRIIWSAVQVNNHPALAFWQKLGYIVTGEPQLQPDQTTVFYIRKDL